MIKHASILGREAYLGICVGGVSHVPKILVMGQSNGSFSKKKNKHTVDKPLHCRSMNKYPQCLFNILPV
jgi:hypothetical protein